MDIIFSFVYYSLVVLSRLTGFTYEEINIIVYFFVIPFIYLALIDRIIKKHILKVAFVVAVLAFFFWIHDFSHYAGWLFNCSVEFLQGFSRIGWDYVLASVIICVVIPGILFCVLFYYAYRAKINSIMQVLRKKEI